MNSFWKVWETEKELIRERQLLLFLDFDGTLAPLRDRPEQAQLPLKTRGLLKKLSKNPSCKLCVITGRVMADIKVRTGIEGIVYAANHGLQISGPGIAHETRVSREYRKNLSQIKRELEAVIASYKGAFIEDKSLSLSVHFRLVAIKDLTGLLGKIKRALLPWSEKELIKVKKGKKVFEIRPPNNWDKGKAALWIIDSWMSQPNAGPPVSLYCGDDETDEDAFRALADRGITVCVGPCRESAARYYLDDQEEVNDLLAKIAELKG